MDYDHELEPSALLVAYADLLRGDLPGPVLDLACGECHNGIFAAHQGCEVICCDRAAGRLADARRFARRVGVSVTLWETDLEGGGPNPFLEESYGAILVFRYLHRPLMANLKKALGGGGLLFYETYTMDQVRFGRPHSPDHLLEQGELLRWYEDWSVIHYFEGILENPRRAMAQLVARKPKGGFQSGSARQGQEGGWRG